MTIDSQEALARRCENLEAELAKLSKINKVLMSRVERSMDMQGSAFSLFQAATALESKVGERTVALQQAMTELERSNEQLRISMEAADAANRAKSRFLATMSHEIRTPLNGVLGMAELLQTTTLDNRQRSFLDIIVNSGQSLLSLINGILDLSRIEAGRMDLAYTEVSPRECVEVVFDMVAERARAKNLELVANIDESVPQKIHSDVLRLRQVLVNLVGNAVKFTERGTILVKVTAEATNGTGVMLRFTVSDSGIGVAADKLQRIFDPFTQADASTTRQHGGTGLGLAICQRLVELMGGQITVQSEPGVGSAFTFTISAEPIETGLPTQLNAQKLNGKRIGVAVENHELARVIHRLCKQEGAILVPANQGGSSGNSAPSANESNMDALIVDEVLYQNAGGEQAEASCPMLLLTNRLSIEDAGAQTRVVERLMKPLKARELIKSLCRLCATVNDTSAVPAFRIEPKSLRANVLLVEDNDINREVASEMLRGFGCSVTCASNGQQAIDKWRAGNFDLILMDFQMPIMDGISATEFIRSEESVKNLRRTPIVALTANAFEEDKSRALQVGCDAFLTKPISRAPFFGILDRVLGEARREKSAGPMHSPIEPTAFAVAALDQRAIREIAALGNPELLGRLIQMYLNDSPKKVGALASARDDGNAQAVFTLAHTLKSASAQLGGQAVAVLCREMEGEAKRGQLPSSAAIERLTHEHARLCAALEILEKEQAA